jgi:hypothetical protein
MPVNIVVEALPTNIDVEVNASQTEVSSTVSIPVIEEVSVQSSPPQDLSNYATIPYVNIVSGELSNQIQTANGASGVSSLNTLAGIVSLLSSSDFLRFQNTGNNINIREKPQNTIFYRNTGDQITGIQYNTTFVRIYRNDDDQITGVYYPDYYKKILFDGSDNITGVNIVYL